MITEDLKNKISESIEKELSEIEFGKIYIELIIRNRKIVHLNIDRRKSMNIYQK